MPSKSKKQFEFMLAAANDREFAEKNDISQTTAKEWVYKDYEKVVEDSDHGEVIGVKVEDAKRYLKDHETPSQENAVGPPSSNW